MLAGEPPFTGPTAQAVVARRLSEPARAVRPVRPAVPDGSGDSVAARAGADPGRSLPRHGRVRRAPDASIRAASTPARRADLRCCGAVVGGDRAGCLAVGAPKLRRNAPRSGSLSSLSTSAGYAPTNSARRLRSGRRSRRSPPPSGGTRPMPMRGRGWPRPMSGPTSGASSFPASLVTASSGSPWPRRSECAHRGSRERRGLGHPGERDPDCRSDGSNPGDPLDCAGPSSSTRPTRVPGTSWHSVSPNRATWIRRSPRGAARSPSIPPTSRASPSWRSPTIGGIQWDSSTRWTDSAIAVDPSFQMARITDGYTAVERGDFARARAAFDAAERLSTDIEVVTTLSGKALAAARAGASGEARACSSVPSRWPRATHRRHCTRLSGWRRRMPV